MQVNIWKIIYLNYGKKKIKTWLLIPVIQNLRSCEKNSSFNVTHDLWATGAMPFVPAICICKYTDPMQSCRISIINSNNTSVKFYSWGLTKGFHCKSILWLGTWRFVQLNLSWKWINVENQSWIIVILTTGCKQITNSRQHSALIRMRRLIASRIAW